MIFSVALKTIWADPTATPTPDAHPDGMTAAQYAARQSIGINLDFHRNASPQIMFVDAMKQALPWVADNTEVEDDFDVSIPVEVDADGWPLQVPFSIGNVDHTVQTIIFNGLGGNYPAGLYTVRFEGDGHLVIAGDAELREMMAGGTYTTNVTPSDDGIYLAILSSPNDPLLRIRNIEIIMPGHAATAREQPFNPAYLDFLRPFSVLRTSQILSMNGEDYGCDTGASHASADCTRNWDERVQVTDALQSGLRGVAIEYIIDLVNELDCDLWLNVLHGADLSYLDGLAELVACNLEPERTVFLELSNETWNSSIDYPQYHHYIQRGLEVIDDTSGDPGTGPNMEGLNDFDTGRRYFAHKWAEACHRMQLELAPRGIRMVKVLPSFSEGYTDVTGRMLTHLLDITTVNPHNMQPDAVAVAAYVGIPYAPWAEQALAAAGSDLTEINRIKNLFNETNIMGWLRQNISNQLFDPIGMSGDDAVSVPFFLTAQQAVINAHTAAHPALFPDSVPVVAYEGGQHLAFFTEEEDIDADLLREVLETHNLPEMEFFYRELCQAWFANQGGVFVSYTNLSTPRPFGNFGIAEHLMQTLPDTPKVRGHLRAMSDLDVANVQEVTVTTNITPSRQAQLRFQVGDQLVVTIERDAIDRDLNYEYSRDLILWQPFDFLEDEVSVGVDSAVIPRNGNFFLRCQ